MHSRLLVFALSLASIGSVCAQQPTRPGEPELPGLREPASVQTPNAAGLGTFANPAVSQFIGTPEISIPLHTVQESELSLPITLRYTATGFRPDEHPGWVGMGWNLQAGGVITRTVKSVPDDLAEVGCNTWPVYGFYFTNQVLRPTSQDWASRAFLEGIAGRSVNPEFIDTEPDEFSFILPGCSGTFYKDSDGDNSAYGSLSGRGGWKVRCDQPVRVTVNNPNDPMLTVPFDVPDGIYSDQCKKKYPKTFSGFTITTADGVQYVFGHNEGNTGAPSDRPAIEYSIGLHQQRTYFWTANAWYLTKIISPSANQITLTYTRASAGTPGRFISQMYNSIDETLKVESATNTNPPPSWFPSPLDFSLQSSCARILNGEGVTTTILKAMKGKLVAPVYLERITTKLSEIVFERSASRELRYGRLNRDDVYNMLTPKPEGEIGMGASNYPFIEAEYKVLGKLSFSNSLAQLQWQKLNAIKIKARGQLLKTWQLTYSDAPNVTDAVAETKRLTLLSVAEIGANGNTKPPYRFSYYKNNDGLPEYLMFVSDHWGFYNNITNETSADKRTTPNLPDYTNLSVYRASREPDINPAVYLRGVLTGITYPTGGYTNFEYDQHRYGGQVDTMRTFLTPGFTGERAAGGLRIRRITSATVNNPQPGQQLVTEYFYVKNYTPASNPAQLPSSGILGGQIKYTYSNRIYRGAGSTSSAWYSQSTFSSQSVLPACGTSQGGHVGYSQVVEKRSDGSYTKYYFTNFDASFDSDNQNALLDMGHFDEPPLQSLESNKVATSVYDQFSSRAEERGKLLLAADFNANGTCVQRRRITYTAYNTGNEFARTAYGRQLNICGSAYSALQGSSYKLYTYAYLPTSKTTTTFNLTGTNGVTSSLTSEYKTLSGRTVNLPWKESTTDSKGMVQTQWYTYPFDYLNVPVNSTEPVARGIAAMTGLFMIGSPIEVLTTQNDRLTGAKVQTYTFPTASSTTLKPYRTWQLELTAPLLKSQYASTQFSGNSFVLDPKLQLKRTHTEYDQFGNLLSVQHEGNVNTTYIWDYSRTLPVAEIHNALPSQTAYAGFESDVSSDPNTFARTEPYGWGYDPRQNQNTHWRTGGGMTGKGYYRLDGGWGVSRAGIPPGEYDLTFWAKGNRDEVWVFTSSGDQELYRSQGATIAQGPGQGYRLISSRIRINQGSASNPTGSINIDAYGRQIDIDDIRLVPVGGQMTSYTHEPQVGVTSVSDVTSRPIRYEFDDLQRLKAIKDAEGNVFKHLEYHYQQ